jgi:hypothetical protein
VLALTRYFEVTVDCERRVKDHGSPLISAYGVVYLLCQRGSLGGGCCSGKFIVRYARKHPLPCVSNFIDVEANVTFEDRTSVVTCIRSLSQNAINAAAKTRSSTATCRMRRAPLHQ